jgi:hypothetical protein
MEYVIRIKCDNAAFDGEPNFELARILRSVGHTLENGRTNMALLDINGNKVGTARLIKNKGA